MRERHRWLVAIAAAVLVAIGAGVAAAGAGPQNQNDGVLGALLTEVRGLRQAMEQMASAGPRVQLALGRLQLQEQRVNGMIRRLETVREAIAKAERETSQAQAQVTSMEGIFKGAATDIKPGEHNPFADNHVIAMLKGAAATSEAEVQRLRAEEAQLAAQIAAEQGRWAEFNRTLEDLERALSRR